MHARPAGEDGLAMNVAGLALLLTLVALLALAWCLAKIASLLVRVWGRHPRSKALWIATGSVLLLTGGAALAPDQPAVMSLAGLSLIGLVLTARAVDLYHDPLFQRELTRDTFVHQVLHEPWW